MDIISFEDFKKIEIKIGKVINAEKIENSDKLLRLEIDFGAEKRQIVAGIARQYLPESLIGKEMPIVTNLAPKTLKDVESQGMILAASDNGNPVILMPEKTVAPGSEVR